MPLTAGNMPGGKTKTPQICRAAEGISAAKRRKAGRCRMVSCSALLSLCGYFFYRVCSAKRIRIAAVWARVAPPRGRCVVVREVVRARGVDAQVVGWATVAAS